MFFSWPSRGEASPTAYLSDYDVSLEAADAFNEFLDLLKSDAGIEYVHVIAHSMGNRVVANALETRSDSVRVIDQLVLAAPDVFADRFKSRFLRILPVLALRVTLYVSDKDKALITSSQFRGGSPRAGQVEGGLLEASAEVARFDAIDASELETDFLSHSYYANNNSVLSDIYCLLKGRPPSRRPLLVLAGLSWRFKSPSLLGEADAADCGVIDPPGPESGLAAWFGGVGVLVLLLAMALVVRRRTASSAIRNQAIRRSQPHGALFEMAIRTVLSVLLALMGKVSTAEAPSSSAYSS